MTKNLNIFRTSGSYTFVALVLAAAWASPLRSLGADVRYKVINLEAGARKEIKWSGARSINENGDVAGGYIPWGEDEGMPFVYKRNGGFVGLDGLNGGALSINDRGQVVVFGYVPGTLGGTNAWRYTPGVGYEPLGTLAGAGEIGDVPIGINNLGQVVGRSDIPVRPWQVAFLYTDGVGMVSLGSLGTNRAATAEAINDAGQVAGHSGLFAFLYTQETGMVSIGQGCALAINNRGVVAGRTLDDEAAIFENGTTRRLGRLGGSTWANGLNDYKVAVGTTVPVRSGFVWSEAEGMVKLDTLVEPGWFIYDIWAINNNGQIVGEASNKAVRLDPIPPKLAIQPSATNLVVSWSPAWPGLVLEATKDLSAPDWQPIATSGTNVMSLSRSEPHRFFRLNLDGIRGLCCAPE